MILKLYGDPRSPTASLVTMVLYEKEIPFEYIKLDIMAGQNRTPEYLAKQPFGQIPCIDDNGFIIYESRAICRYLEDTYPNQGTRLIPSDPKKRALFEQAAAIENYSFDRFVTPLVYEYLFRKPENRDTQQIKTLTESFSKKLDVYEQILSKQKYLAGDELTLTDLYHIPMGVLFFEIENLIHTRPNVTKWFEEMCSRTSWQKIKDFGKTA